MHDGYDPLRTSHSSCGGRRFCRVAFGAVATLSSGERRSTAQSTTRVPGLVIAPAIEPDTLVVDQNGFDYNRFLGYVRGGGAWERDEYRATTIILGTAYTARETRSGWTIGVGGEYAFTNVLSGFVEYGYYDFGTRQIGLTPQVAGVGPAFVDIKETKSVVRAGLNFRFGGYALVAAKY